MSDIIRGTIKELSGKIRQQWAKLTDSDLDDVKGNWDELAGRLQKNYGYTKLQAQDEIDKFHRSIQ